eukprot:SAG11_NODE_25469_length_358_cov_0.992278_1_plen_47_part_10
MAGGPEPPKLLLLTIKSKFVTRAIVLLNFVEDVRNLVCGIDDVGLAL